VVRGVALILNGTLYTAVFDHPLEQSDRFATLSRNQRIPARVEGNHPVVRFPNGKEAKAKIIRHESLRPNQPQPSYRLCTVSEFGNGLGLCPIQAR
jgi:hypothetical protein